MADPHFVGRDSELTRFEKVLERAVAGRGQTMFVRGDPGSGKSTLIREAARRAQLQHQELVVVSGNCNAQSGLGDPFLPFREILSLLTGDLEGRSSVGALNPVNEDRLRRVMTRSIQVLVEVGPDLVGAFVPGYKLMATVGKAMAEKVGWMDDLERLVLGRQSRPDAPGMEQSRLFEQFTRYITTLSRQMPIMIVVDDLHWADAGSIHLFFHLARRIEGSRILLVGSYRPAEVALGRDGQRHPLEPILNELQRYYGDITLDLDQAQLSEGRDFVNALIDAYPNMLSERFRESLYRHTGGHPLFTVELLLSMVQRGNLVEDEYGRWIEATEIDWTTLPARIEGVIEERIARLDDRQREILSIASVEGMVFTAQLISRILQMPERSLLQTLTQDLERQHQLVRERGEIEVRQQRLSRFQFSHALFQQYLYNELSLGERRLLHREVVEILEEIYGEQRSEIAVQLAYHSSQWGDFEAAVDYRILAGDTAARVHAYDEARLHYDAALAGFDTLEDTAENQMQLVDTTSKWQKVSFFAVDPRRSLARLRAAEPALRTLQAAEPDEHAHQIREARLYYWMGRTHHYLNELPQAVEYYRRALALHRSSDDHEFTSIPLGVIARVLTTQGYFPRAEQMLRRAFPGLEALENWVEWVYACGYMAVVLAAQGRYNEALEYGQRACRKSLAMGDPTLLAVSQSLIAFAHHFGGRLPEMLEHSQHAIDAALRARSDLYLYTGYGVRAWVQSRLKEHEAAEESMRLAEEAGDRLGGQLLLSHLYAAIRAEMALHAGRTDEAIERAREAVQAAAAVDGPYAGGRALWTWGAALAHGPEPDWEAAEERLAAAARAFESSGAVVDLARVHADWGQIARAQGRRGEAIEHLRLAADGMERAGFEQDLLSLRRWVSRIESMVSRLQEPLEVGLAGLDQAPTV